ncbi:AraC family transcriptional regulator [Paenibacillus mesophilus]|uniref:AraC family transcriptional regulator n=1 Tax=Paenibacillus mesophilus TaxID=2582849 RepID=UPI00130537FD|nr:AraC family transcriptional regulator [Paenibacillus mesophilus]
MTTFPIFQDSLRLNKFKKGELPLFITHYSMGHGYPNHHHEFAEMSLVTAGQGTEIVNGVEHRLKPGSICLLPPYHLHALKLDAQQPLQKFCCMFDMNLMFQPEFAEIGPWLVKLSDEMTPFYDMPDQPFQTIRSVLSALGDEYASDSLGKQGFMRVKLMEAIYLFFRHHPGFASLDSAVDLHPEEWDYVKYVNTHFMEETISLEEVAGKFGVSVFVVRNAFKRLLGKNFLEYLHMLRIRRASSLLTATDMSVAEVAYDVGFSSLRSFTRVFKETTGMSATDYRKHRTDSAK